MNSLNEPKTSDISGTPSDSLRVSYKEKGSRNSEASYFYTMKSDSEPRGGRRNSSVDSKDNTTKSSADKDSITGNSNLFDSNQKAFNSLSLFSSNHTSSHERKKTNLHLLKTSLSHDNSSNNVVITFKNEAAAAQTPYLRSHQLKLFSKKKSEISEKTTHREDHAKLLVTSSLRWNDWVHICRPISKAKDNRK